MSHSAGGPRPAWATAEEAEAVWRIPRGIVAHEMPVEAAPAKRTGNKRSRVHEAFTRDPNDTEYVICQLTEGVKGRHVCGGRIKLATSSSTKPCWNHVETFHPHTYKQLKGDGDDEVDDAASNSCRQALASSTSVAVKISYQQMVDTLCSAPRDVLADAIEALQQARDRRG